MLAVSVDNIDYDPGNFFRIVSGTIFDIEERCGIDIQCGYVTQDLIVVDLREVVIQPKRWLRQNAFGLQNPVYAVSISFLLHHLLLDPPSAQTPSAMYSLQQFGAP